MTMSTLYLTQTFLTLEQLAAAGWKEAKADNGAQALTDGTNYAHDLEWTDGKLDGFCRYGMNDLRQLALHTNAVSEHEKQFWDILGVPFHGEN